VKNLPTGARMGIGAWEKIYFHFICLTNYFKGKEEGDIVSIKMYDKSIVLHLNQSGYRYADLGRFEDALQRLKDRFVENPNYFCISENSLLSKGIIVKNGDKTHHGPNGFEE
jgi:hypothetical protein